VSVCRKAMDQAANNPQLLAVLGEHIEKGPWYEATMGLDREGHSASCTFSVIGSLGTANLHLRAVKFEGTVLSLSVSTLLWWFHHCRSCSMEGFSLCMKLLIQQCAMKCHLHIAPMCCFVILFVSFCDAKLSR